MFITSGSAPFDADGRASVELGPTVYGIEWTVTLMASNTSSVTETTLEVFRQTESPSAMIADSRRANRDQNDDTIKLRNLEKLIFVWRGGSPGTIATINLEGEIENALRE